LLMVKDGERAQATDAVFHPGADLGDADLQGMNLNNVNLERANLKGANLRDAQLRRTDLRGACLGGVALVNANLNDADLRDADLQHANFEAVDLCGAILRDADLRQADLSKANGLTAVQLAGADLARAALPKDLSFTVLLNAVDNLGRQSMRAFGGVLAACLYCILTISQTRDAQLIADSTSSKLPIIGTEIPIVGFYTFAPILLLGIHLYFQLHLQKFWEALGDLPAIFPDGVAFERRISSWLLTDIGRHYFPRLRRLPSRLRRMRWMIANALLWWMVPLTLVLLWLRYLKRHDLPGTLMHVDLIGTSIAVAVAFRWFTSLTLRQRKAPNRRSRVRSVSMTILAVAARACVIGALWFAFFRLSVPAAGGHLRRPVSCNDLEARHGSPGWVLYTGGERQGAESEPEPEPWMSRIGGNWASRIFRFLDYWPNADVAFADISTPPQNWTGKEIDLVKGANIQDVDLQAAFAAESLLAKSQMQRATLCGANLIGADLRGAGLEFADLEGVVMRGAKLQKAHLSSAFMWGVRAQETDFSGADLQGSCICHSDLAAADFHGAGLNRADFGGAKLSGADLSDTDLRHADLRGADFGIGESYLAEMESELGSYVQACGLESLAAGAANLSGARIDGADFRGVDLSHVTGLEQAQIDVACTDETTKLPADLKLPPACKVTGGHPPNAFITGRRVRPKTCTPCN